MDIPCKEIHSLNKKTFHSNNMYQIFTYVKNRDREHSGNVQGVLLYAKIDEEIVPDHIYMMDGNQIRVTTLDLSGDFQCIEEKLNMLMYFFR